MAQYKTNPQHFYSFTFHRLQDGGQTIGNSYLGLDEQKVTKAVIDFACDAAKMDSNSVLTAVSYLGFMSEAEFHAPL